MNNKNLINFSPQEICLLDGLRSGGATKIDWVVSDSVCSPDFSIQFFSGFFAIFCEFQPKIDRVVSDSVCSQVVPDFSIQFFQQFVLSFFACFEKFNAKASLALFQVKNSIQGLQQLGNKDI